MSRRYAIIAYTKVHLPGHGVVNNTVVFRFAGITTDFTACYDRADANHGPSQFSNYLAAHVSQLPKGSAEAARLVVDCAKRFRLCPAKKGDAIGEQLKGVHWVILFLAWHKVAGLLRQHFSPI